jgi:hypothetical protein
MYVAYPLLTKYYIKNIYRHTGLYVLAVQTKIVPVPAVPRPDQPRGGLPEVPVPGGFFCGDPPLVIGDTIILAI